MNTIALNTSSHELLQKGTSLHQAGHLSEAAKYYQQALTASPGNPEALFLLGAIANQNRRFDLGAQLIEQAIAGNGKDARYHTELGVAYQNLDLGNKATRHFRKAIEIQPTFAFAWFNLGNRYLDQGKLDKAVSHYKRAAAFDPERAEYAFNLGTAYQQDEQLELAMEQYDKAIRLQAQFPDALINMGSILLKQERWQEAGEKYQAVLDFSPGDVRARHGLVTACLGAKDNAGAYQALNDLGNAYRVFNDSTNAIACFEKAALLSEDNRDALYNMGAALMDAQELELAAETLKLVTEKDPSFAPAINNLGVVHNRSGNETEARALFERAAGLGSAEGFVNLGNLHSAHLERDRARQAYRSAIDIDPGNPDAYLNLANEYLLEGDPEESENALRSAIAHYSSESLTQTGLAMAHTNLADLLLGQGRFEEGWKTYQWRHGVGHQNPLNPNIPYTDVTQLAALDKTHPLVVVPDQGLGDELFFLRFIEALQNRHTLSPLRVHASDKIAAMLRRSLNVAVERASALAQDGALAPYTVRVSDLALLSGMSATADIPAPLQLNPLDEKLERAKENLSAAPGPYLGITWRAGTARQGGLSKQIALESIAESIRDWPGTIVILQRQPKADEIKALKTHLGDKALIDMSAVNEDLEGMLALLSLIDEYAGVSNTNMHLYAGLGKKGRCLVPYPADWRWMSKGDASPWFPGFTLYRQTQHLSWEQALDGLHDDLKALTE